MADSEQDEQTPDAPAPDAPVADAPVADAPAPAAGSARGSGGGPQELLTPKERRVRRRAGQLAPAREARTPAERQAERDALRRAKAVSRRAQRLKDRAKRAESRANAPAPEPLDPVHAPVEGRRKVRQGVVVSDGADKTITVRVDVARRHRRYEKVVRSSSTLHAHDESNDAHVGDTVRVIESRPLSRTKRWRLVDVLERAQ
jgi:small subunit ribosomal protein S17